MAAAGVDCYTQRPRTPNDQYTHLTPEQITNIQKETSPFFHTIKKERSLPAGSHLPREGGRHYLDRHCSVTNKHLVRHAGSENFGWIDFKYERTPAEAYNTCRGRAAVRWGPNKAGEPTRSHFFGESTDRYTSIDMYRRPPTNYPGRVVMDCGRPADGYYAQRYPSRTTWFSSTVPLNRTTVLQSVPRKSTAEYAEIQAAQGGARQARQGEWPTYSEYTDKFLMRTKTQPTLTGLQEKKKHLAQEAC